MPSVIVRPSGNVNALWGTNTYTLIDEAVNIPNDDANDGQVTAASTDSLEDQGYLFSLPGLGSTSNISHIAVYGRGFTDSGPLVGSGLLTVNGSSFGRKAITFSNGGETWDSGVWFVNPSTPITSVQVDILSPNITKGNSYNVTALYAEFFYTSGTVNAYPPIGTGLFYNEFIGNFGISNSGLSHTQVLSLMSSLRPSGDRLRSIDTDYLELKVPPNSGVLYERTRFNFTNLNSNFVHLGSGLNLNTNFDFNSNSPSGCQMEVWLDSGNGYNGDYYWYSGPIPLSSGTNQTVSIASGTRLMTAANIPNASITIGVKYDHQRNYYNDLKINSLSLAGEGWFYPSSYNDIIPLYIMGAVLHNSGIPLYTLGHSTNSSGLPLYLKVHAPDSGFIPLYIRNANSYNSGIPLYIRGGLSDDMPLFLQGPIPSEYSSGIPLTIFASTAGTSGLFKTMPFFISGDRLNTNTMNLYIQGWEPPTVYTNNMVLFLKNGNLDGTTDFDNSIPLFLKNSVSGYNDTMPLILYNEMGTSGYFPFSGTMNLYISRSTDGFADGIPLYIQGPSGITNNIPLYLLAGQSGVNDNIPFYIRGKAEPSGNIPLFVRGL